jgi:flavorubredoxin
LEAYQITEGIYWVGAIDWHLRSFHGYTTYRGTTYNAYLIIDSKITLIDTVKEKFADEMFARIRSVIDPNTMDSVKVKYTLSEEQKDMIESRLTDALRYQNR